MTLTRSHFPGQWSATVGLACLLLTAICATAQSAPPSGPLDSIPAQFLRQGSLDVWRAKLPGRLESSTIHCSPESDEPTGEATGEASCDLFLILRQLDAEPSDGLPAPRGLYRLELSDPTELVRLAIFPRLETGTTEDRWFAQPSVQVLAPGVPSDGVFGHEKPSEVRLFVAWRAQGFLVEPPSAESGSTTPWTFRQIVRLEDGGEWRTLSLVDSESALLAATDVGRLDLFRFHQGAPASHSTHPLPVTVERASRDLALRSPEVHWLAKKPAVFAVGPEETDHLRLRSLVIDPGTSETSESPETPETVHWSMLPASERVVDSTYWTVEGRVLLAVVTLRADRVGILERKKLRLFELGEDRTRAGSRPFFATLTASRMWQDLSVDLVRSNSTFDLVLVQPEGLGGDKLAVDRYTGRDGAIEDNRAPLRFDSKPQRSIVKIEEAWWSYGQDWNGDSIADLLSLSSGIVRLFPGIRTPKKGPLERQAAWQHSLDLPLALSSPSKKDDGPQTRLEAMHQHGILIVRSRVADGPDRLELIRSTAASAGSAGSLVVGTMRSKVAWN